MRFFGRKTQANDEGRSWVRMLVSYASSDGHDLVAGEQYVLDPKQADELILKGYADGELSRPYSGEEVMDLNHGNQEVTV